MSVETYFNDLFSTLPPGECLQLTIEKWEWIRTRFGRDCGTSHSAPPEPVVRPSFGVSDLAGRFARPVSTMRALLGQGICGDPETLKPNRKTYEVGYATVERLHAAVAAGQQLGNFCLLIPRVLPEQARTAEDQKPRTPNAPAADHELSVHVAARSAAPEAVACPALREQGSARRGREPKSAAPAARTRRRDRATPTDLGAWRAHMRS